MDLTPGQAIGQYIIVQKIGEGGMGAVYKADQPSIPRAVVIKVLGASFADFPDARDRFRRELNMITRLEHPHILPVYDFGEVNDSPYIVMRFMMGGSLQERLQGGTLNRNESLRLLDQVAVALDFAHDRGIIHRDLKPANILLDEAANAYLADFGLAKTVGGTQDLTATGSVLGSPAYMSPEQARGEKLDRESDIYSFAVLVYRALSGRLPFEAETAWEFITKHIGEEPTPIRRHVPDLPPAVDSVLAAGLAKDPNARPQRATDLMASVRSALAGGSGTAAVPARATAVGAPTGASTAGGTLISPSAPPSGRASAVAARRAAPAWRLPAVIAAGAVGLLVVGAIAAVILYLGGTSLLGSRPTTYPVGDQPRALLFDGSSLWVANYFDNSLTKLAASECGTSPEVCGQDLGPFPVDVFPGALAFDGERLWVTSSVNQSLSVVDPASGEVIARHPLPHVPTALLWDQSWLWIANDIAGTVTKIAADGSILADTEVGQGPVALARDGTWLWTVNRESKDLMQIDPENSQIHARVTLDGVPQSLAFDGRSLWIALGDLGQVVEVDPTNPTIGRRVDLGSPPVALWFDGERLWAAAPEAGKVFAIDTVLGEVVETIAIEGYPVALASTTCGVNCRDLWTANQSGDTVSRISIE